MILDDDWDDEFEEYFGAWVRFLSRLGLDAASFVQLVRAAFRLQDHTAGRSHGR